MDADDEVAEVISLYMYYIVKDVCSAIFEGLRPEYMKEPNKNRWEEISNDFFEIWNVPNALGAVDGKHIKIKKPQKSGSAFYNYKSFTSVVLMGVVDAEGLFVTIDVGDYGRNSDGGVFRNSNFGQALSNDLLDLPSDKPLPGCSNAMPLFFIGDEAFPMSKNMLRPFPRRSLTPERRIFNYRLSRARRIVECAFGMLVAKWNVLGGSIICRDLEKIDSIVCACCILHNFVRKEEGKLMPRSGEFNPEDYFDAEHIATVPDLLGNRSNLSSGSRSSNISLQMREC